MTTHRALHGSLFLSALFTAGLLFGCGGPTPVGESQDEVTSSPEFRPFFFEGAEREAAFEERRRLREIKTRHREEFRSIPGVIGIGIGLDRAARRHFIQLVIDREAPEPDVPTELEGVPFRVVRGPRPIAQNGGICLDAAGQQINCHADALPQPVQMGNSMSTASGAGSMGFKACELSSARSVFVTAAHVATDGTLCPATASIGAFAYHPALSDFSGIPPTIGTVALHVGPTSGGNVDATSIYSTDAESLPSIRDIGAYAQIPGLVGPGDSVQKSGRTTGYTTADVIDADLDAYPILYSCFATPPPQNDLIWVQAASGASWSQGGDSGSAVLDFSDPPRIVGLHVAGLTPDGFANPITPVLSQLGLTLTRTACIDVTSWVEAICPALMVTEPMAQGAMLRDLLYLFRDDIIAESSSLRHWIDRFYSVAPQWVALYQARPELLAATREAVWANRSVVRAVAEGDPVTVTTNQLASVRQLIQQHAQATNHPALRQAFLQWRTEIGTSAVQGSLQVTVQ